MLKKLFDAYSLQARLQPAVLALFPALITTSVWVPAVYEMRETIVGILLACGIVVFLAYYARACGQRAERKLFAEWGATPTTRWLRHRDDTLDSVTKARYYSFLGSHVPNGWKAPTPQEENADPQRADEYYQSAARWLREFTRDKDKYPLVFKENVSYGFHRNLYGLKSMGVTIAILCLVGGTVPLVYPEISGSRINVVTASPIITSIVFIIGWIGIVKGEWVRGAAEGYARALLAVCDT